MILESAEVATAQEYKIIRYCSCNLLFKHAVKLVVDSKVTTVLAGTEVLHHLFYISIWIFRRKMHSNRKLHEARQSG